MSVQVRDATGKGAAKSAQRALDVLVLLKERLQPLPTMEIARELAIPKSSVHHLLNTMRERGFVRYDETLHLWALDVIVFEIGSAYLRTAPLQRQGRATLRDLAQRLGETAHLAILHGPEVLYIDKEQAPGTAQRLVTEVGLRLPAQLTAVGRAILADLPDEEVDAVFGGDVLAQRTDHGVDSLAQLLTDLAEVRANGYAVDREMVSPGITCVAAAVRSHEGVPVAALGLTFLSAQRDEGDVQRLAGEVRESARELSRALGFTNAGNHEEKAR